jgi:hypothetical protein
MHLFDLLDKNLINLGYIILSFLNDSLNTPLDILNILVHFEAVKLWSWTAKKYLLIPLGISVISLVSASQPQIQVRI